MCELMGLSFVRPVSAAFSFHAFAQRGEENADGWGLGWYPDRSLALVKEPVRWGASRYSSFLESYPSLRSCIYIAHVRHKTTGGTPTHADTHPFQRELAGREYCFAHNGTVLGLGEAFPLERFHPLGATDSEYLFCLLLDAIAGEAVDLSSEPGWRWLHERLLQLNARGKLNCLLSDGERLFCYHDVNAHKGLSLRKVSLDPDHPRRLEDSDMQIALNGGASNHGTVVATQPLSPTGWQRFHAGELLVLEQGTVRFSSHRGESELELVDVAEGR